VNIKKANKVKAGDNNHNDMSMKLNAGEDYHENLQSGRRYLFSPIYGFLDISHKSFHNGNRKKFPVHHEPVRRHFQYSHVQFRNHQKRANTPNVG
jgi:hypothetical protein